jgi:hypothetical protein
MSKRFTPEVIKEAFLRAKGRCECTLLNCKAHGRTPLTLAKGDPRCARTFFFTEQGDKWTARPIDPAGSSTSANCTILCLQCAEERDEENLPSGPGTRKEDER